MYELRNAVAADYKEINDVSEHLDYTKLSLVEAEAKLNQLLVSEIDFVYVATVQGRVVAWLHAFKAQRLASPDFIEIAGLVVCPEHRDQGLGRKLVDRVTLNNPGKLRVRCNEKRSDAHKFYESIGFQPNKSQRVFERNT